MKSTQLILTCLVVVTTWAQSGDPLGFFVSINGTLKPVISLFNISRPEIFSLHVAELNYVPTDIIFKNQYPSTSRGRVGFYKDQLVHGHNIEQIHFGLTNSKNIENHQFYVCETLPYPYNTAIMRTNTDPSCIEVEIYLFTDKDLKRKIDESLYLPIQGESNQKKLYPEKMNSEQESEKSNPEQESEKLNSEQESENNIPSKSIPGGVFPHNLLKRMVSPSNYPYTPYAFFVKTNTSLMPLSYSPYIKDGPEPVKFGMFVHHPTMNTPVEFTFRHNIATSTVKNMSGFAGFHQDTLAFGPSISEFFFEIDTTLRLQGYTFYSCGVSIFPRTIYKDYNAPDLCEEVSIYILPYNRTSRRPVEGSYIPDKGRGSVKPRLSFRHKASN